MHHQTAEGRGMGSFMMSTLTSDVCIMSYGIGIFLLCPGRGAKYCDEYVSLSVHSHNSKPHNWASPNFFMYVAYGPDTVLLWPYCNALCTSGFVDDVIFSYHGASGPESSTMLCLRCSPDVGTSWTSDGLGVVLNSLECDTEPAGAKSDIYDCLVFSGVHIHRAQAQSSHKSVWPGGWCIRSDGLLEWHGASGDSGDENWWRKHWLGYQRCRRAVHCTRSSRRVRLIVINLHCILLPSNRQHLCCDVFLEAKWEHNNQTVLYCVLYNSCARLISCWYHQFSNPGR